jgi:hypothetical protein
MIEKHAAFHRVVGLLTMQQNLINALLEQTVELRLTRERTDRHASGSISDDPVRHPGSAVIGEVRT